MKIYLVGGAVRDKLLKLPVSERDWVVVGASPQEMLDLGYKQVGKDFPVFLHPETKEEYALARTERKTGPGYTGFDFHAAADVTLEEDLVRRDLTINAIAESTEGELIDPYGGQDDLAAGRLRHVSPAFSEDPVRVLRVARFAARFGQYGFSVAHDTNALMRNMVADGEVNHLVPERVWAELCKALATDTPEKFFTVLHGCNALTILFPEIAAAYESNSGAHKAQNLPAALEALRDSAAKTNDTHIRFAVLLVSLQPDQTTEQRIATTEALCKRFRIPGDYLKLAVSAIQLERNITDNNPEELLEAMESTRAFNDPTCWNRMLKTCTITHHIDSARAELLDTVKQKSSSVNAACLEDKSLKGPAVGAAIRELRCRIIESILLQQ
ncbi:CCA tRNA nucleotidyltransferase [hydrothermal vent metagenome]|uniref:CCA tRNA nucleotidyltransferase n=1 Tax=hydrothermal vent metagenome TaxID=652676 RepID=A0A3B0YUI7_9ZZZZ